MASNTTNKLARISELCSDPTSPEFQELWLHFDEITNEGDFLHECAVGRRKYEECFTADDLVMWLIDNAYCASRAQGGRIGQSMLLANIFHHVVLGHAYKEFDPSSRVDVLRKGPSPDRAPNLLSPRALHGFKSPPRTPKTSGTPKTPGTPATPGSPSSSMFQSEESGESGMKSRDLSRDFGSDFRKLFASFASSRGESVDGSSSVDWYEIFRALPDDEMHEMVSIVRNLSRGHHEVFKGPIATRKKSLGKTAKATIITNWLIDQNYCVYTAQAKVLGERLLQTRVLLPIGKATKVAEFNPASDRDEYILCRAVQEMDCQI